MPQDRTVETIQFIESLGWTKEDSFYTDGEAHVNPDEALEIISIKEKGFHRILIHLNTILVKSPKHETLFYMVSPCGRCFNDTELATLFLDNLSEEKVDRCEFSMNLDSLLVNLAADEVSIIKLMPLWFSFCNVGKSMVNYSENGYILAVQETWKFHETEK